MHFRTAASAAILACAAHASAEPQPYKLAMMPVLGMSLSRRDTNGYQPEQTVCGDGNTCAEACGAGYAQCAAVDDSVHCFNPEAKQQCCQDGTGNSCDEGYYCTNDTKKQTWCCPDKMSLSECAAAYNVDGGLQTPVVSTSTSAPPTTSAEPTTTSAPETTSAPVTTEEPTSTEEPVTTEEPTTPSPATSSVISTSAAQPNTTVHETPVSESCTTYVSASTGTIILSHGSNSTITSGAPSQPSESTPATTTPGPQSGAGAVAYSPLLLLAGLVALL